jgi:neutral ceramidase
VTSRSLLGAGADGMTCQRTIRPVIRPGMGRVRMCRWGWGLTVLLGLLVGCCGAANAFAGWQVGMATMEITPPEPMWMSGYAARQHPADGKLTDLWAKAMAVQDESGERCVLVTLDLVGIDAGMSGRISQEVERRFGIARERLALTTTHTHSGPVVGNNLRPMYALEPASWRQIDRYTRWVEEQVLEVVGAALSDLAPAELAWTVGWATFAANRRENGERDIERLRAERQVRGPCDHAVPMLLVKRPGEPAYRGIVCGYACHATVLDGYQWSGDWPGYAQMALEEAFPGAIAMVWVGCGADQNPMPRRDVALAERYGALIAEAAKRAVAGERLHPIGGKLAAEYREIDLPYAHVPSREQLVETLEHSNVYEVRRARHLLELLDESAASLPESYRYPIQSWRLGDGPRWIFLSGEVVVDYALEIKSRLGSGGTWVAGYSNDVMAYIPSQRVLEEGGYEGGGAMVYYGLPGPWQSGVEDRILAEVGRQTQRLGGSGEVHWEPLPVPLHRDRRDLSQWLDGAGQLRPIETVADWEQRRADAVAGLQQAMGRLPFADELDPLTIEVLHTEAFASYDRQSIRYGVDSGWPATADLYLPHRRREAPAGPAVLALHPTHAIGKRVVGGEGTGTNRNYAMELAELGFVVLAPDYPSFGDQASYAFLSDPYLSGSMRALVAHRRGLDVLASHPWVDPNRLGAIGHSLGGHNAIFLAAVDARIRATVTSCGWTPFPYYYGGDVTGWTSQRYMPRLRDVFSQDLDRLPFDFDELIASLAPRAFFTNSPEADSNFEVQGIRDAEPKIRSVYALYEAEDRLEFHYPAAEHDFPEPQRQAAYRFLTRWLGEPLQGGPDE